MIPQRMYPLISVTFVQIYIFFWISPDITTIFSRNCNRLIQVFRKVYFRYNNKDFRIWWFLLGLPRVLFQLPSRIQPQYNIPVKHLQEFNQLFIQRSIPAFLSISSKIYVQIFIKISTRNSILYRILPRFIPPEILWKISLTYFLILFSGIFTMTIVKEIYQKVL